MRTDPTQAEALVSRVFDRVLSGDQLGADMLKAELTGCYSFEIPQRSAISGEAALGLLSRIFVERS